MTAVTRKYNPGFLTDDELVASFCVRTHEFESVIEMLRESTGSAVPHQIVIGPRGSGKTSLLLRVAAEIRRDAALSASFYTVVFAEESYEVASAGEFWLEALSRLAAQAPGQKERDALCRSWEELRKVQDDRALGDRCLGALLDFADGYDRRLVLVVENLNGMFRDMADAEEAGWRLRRVLQTEPRVLVLASATSRFDAIDHPDQALYDLFRVLTLRALDVDECAVLWNSVSGRRREAQAMRALQILTGGSPRLLAVLAQFGRELSFRGLMAELLDLVDDHTEYFKGHLESLPAQERRVYLALAALWKPATAREVAERARLDSSKCSSQLKRLVDRGAVEVTGGSPRRKFYYLSERLYNIYYLVRRARGSDPLIEALVRFMASYYAPDELRAIGARIAGDAVGIDEAMQSFYRTAFVKLVWLPALQPYRGELIGVAPADWEAGSEPKGGIRKVPNDLEEARALFHEAFSLAEENSLEDALNVCAEAMERFSDSKSSDVLEIVARVPVFGAAVLVNLNRLDDALKAYDDAVSQFSESESSGVLYWVARALNGKGAALEKRDQWKQALSVYGDVVHRFGKSDSAGVRQQVAEALVRTGLALEEMGRGKEAVAAYHEVIRRFGNSDSAHDIEEVAKAVLRKGKALERLERWEDALGVYDGLVSRHRARAAVFDLDMVSQGLLGKADVYEALDRGEEALAAREEVVRLLGASESSSLLRLIASALIGNGVLLSLMNRPQDALAAFEEVVRRFETRDEPELSSAVETALSGKGFALGAMRRFEDALAVQDEVIRCRQTAEKLIDPEFAAMTIFDRGQTLLALNREEAACESWIELVRRFGEERVKEVRFWVVCGLLRLADVDLTNGRYRAAIERANSAMERIGSELPDKRLQTYLIRASALLALGDSVACEQDVAVILRRLPSMGIPSRETLDALEKISLELGPERMRDLIATSRSKYLLLPLTTALEREMGIESRVPREVEEVAEDILMSFSKLREKSRRTPGRIAE